MRFRIDYFREGVKVASVVSYEPLEGARLDAKRGLKMHRADQAQIRDLAKAGQLVERIDRAPRDPDR